MRTGNSADLESIAVGIKRLMEPSETLGDIKLLIALLVPPGSSFKLALKNQIELDCVPV